MAGAEFPQINLQPLPAQLARFATWLTRDPGAGVWVSDTASGVKAYVRQKEFDLTLPTDAVTVDGGPLMLNRRAVCLDIDSVEYAHTERTVEPVDFGRFMDSVKREPGAWDAACMREVREKRMVEWLLSHDWLQPEQNPEDPQIPGFFYAPLLRNVPLTRR